MNSGRSKSSRRPCRARWEHRRLIGQAYNNAIEGLESRTLLSVGVSGFGNISPTNPQVSDSWTVARAPGASNVGWPQFEGGNDLQITGGGSNEGGAVWYNTPVTFQNFTASFDYTAKGGPNPLGDGFTFTFQNDPRSTNINGGLSTVVGGTGGGLGYSGINNSFAFQFNIFDGSHFGIGTGGTVSDSTGTGAVNLANNAAGGQGDVIHIDLAYDSTKHTVSEHLTDTNNNATYSQVFTNVNLSSITGSSSAYVGFTGGTGGGSAYQDITNFQFQTNSIIPPPPTGGISGFGSWQLQGANGQGIDGSATQDNNNGASPKVSTDGNTLTLTTAAANQASSAFYSATDIYQNFESTFTYTETGGTSNGFTLMLQNDSRGANALGGGGADLGYGTDGSHPAQLINNSFALEFNTTNSTIGVANNGNVIAGTTAQSTGAVSLSSGDPIAVKVDYNSSTITATLTDTNTKATTTTPIQFNNVNLPVILGSNQAWVGLTGGTGSSFANQTISGFSFIPNTAPNPATLNTNPDTTGGTAVVGFSGGKTNGITLNAANGKGLNGSAASNANSAGVPSVSTNGNTLTLAGATAGQASSAFFDKPVPINNFTASFTYQYGGGGTGTTDQGFAFVLENDPRGVNAIGGGAGDLGYGTDGNNPAAAVSGSFAAEFHILNSSAASQSQIGVGINGGISFPALNSNTGAVSLSSGYWWIHVTLSYDSARSFLYESLTDGTTGATYTTGYGINLRGTLGDSAFVGFTGGTGSLNQAAETITNFSYRTSSAPASPAMPTPTASVADFGAFALDGNNADPAGAPGISQDGKTLTLTTQNGDEANAAFSQTPVTYGNFTASFTYTEQNGGLPGEGFTFALEDVPTLGGLGGSIGYGGTVPNSMAVEFNINQTGSITLGGGGAVTTIPAYANTGSVNLLSGSAIQVNLSYNSSAQTLTEVLSDTNNNTFTATYRNVDLSRILQNSPGTYIGFTGGTSGANAQQTISNFSFSGSAVTPSTTAGPVSLGGDFNTYGIGVDGQGIVNGGMDGAAAASNTFFQTNGANYRTVTLNGATQQFNFGAGAGSGASFSNANSLSGAGQIINLPQGQYGNLSFLGLGMNGNQTNQKFTIIYTDGTTQTFTQTLSDWLAGTPATGEQVAFTMNYRLDGSGNKINQGNAIHVYEYNFALDPTKTAASLVMPNNVNVKMFAMNVNAVATVTSISPASGPSGTSVRIQGTGFSTATGVKFGTAAATSYTINPDGSITAVAPAGVFGTTVDATVTNIAGTSTTTSADQFKYRESVYITIHAAINGDDPNGLYNAPFQPSPGTQRSMVEDVVYTFNEPVTIPNANTAFTVVGAGAHPGTAPTTLYAQAVAGSNGTQWAVSLTGHPVGTLGSIANGEYSITLNPSAIFLASDGTTSLPPGSGRTDTFYRLYGDLFGTENVTALDYNRFKQSLTTYNPMFDNYNTGNITALDYNLFKKDLVVNYSGDGFTTTI